jgi:hypothetical protein
MSIKTFSKTLREKHELAGLFDKLLHNSGSGVRNSSIPD